MAPITPLYQPGQDPTGRATGAAVTGGRFVMVAGTKRDGQPTPIRHCTARARSLGVAHDDAARDDVTAICGPGEWVPVEYGGSITAGDDVSSDANGRAVRFDTSGAVNGVAVTTGSSGEFGFIQVK